MKRRNVIIGIGILICVGAMIGYGIYKSNRCEKIRDAYRLDCRRVEWYGNGAGYEYDAYVHGETNRLTCIDRIDPDVLEVMNLWKEQGFSAITERSQEEIDQAVIEIEQEMDEDEKRMQGRSGYDRSETSLYLAIQILKNNYNVLDDSYINENGEKVYVGFDRFCDAVQDIDRHTSHNQKEKDTVYDLFRKKVEVR